MKSVQEYAVEQEAIRKEIHEWQQNLEKSIEEKEKELAVIRRNTRLSLILIRKRWLSPLTVWNRMTSVFRF